MTVKPMFYCCRKNEGDTAEERIPQKLSHCSPIFTRAPNLETTPPVAECGHSAAPPAEQTVARQRGGMPRDRRKESPRRRPFPSAILILSVLGFVEGAAALFGHSRPLSATQLGVPICYKDNDCVAGGICVPDNLGVGRCMCSSSCPLNVPVQCVTEKNLSCVTMGEQYMRKYEMNPPVCHQKRCICPPIFDPIPIQPPIAGFKAMLPMKCDKRDLNTIFLASPSDSAYKGSMATLFCCVNLDPRGYIAANGVYFVQNFTRKREATSGPYDNFSRDIDTLFTVPTCWSLTITNIQPSDSGTYTCVVQPMSAKYQTMNKTLEFVVKTSSRVRRQKIVAFQRQTPRVIQNVTISPNSTSALITWDMQEGPMLKIDLELFRRTDRKTRVWRKSNAKSPVLIEDLIPATPYTLFVTVIDGQTEPFRLTEQFETDEGAPDSPDLEDIRLINGENGRGQMCEVEWKPPRWTRGHITRYYVQVKGNIRYASPNTPIIAGGDFPPSVDLCSNYDGSETSNGIDPQLFHSFYACKYGPLKPNRNYTATIWAETKAGRSAPIAFERQCVMDFAEPDHIEPPESIPKSNTTSFGLQFTKEPDETNGPIACYYLAIVPLPANISVNNLPTPELIVMDTFDKVLQNNLHPSAAENNRYYAYIAESYMEYPERTVVGDGIPRSQGVDPCNVLYLTRYEPNDAALVMDLKYTGFLIARVDRDRGIQTHGSIGADARRFRPVITEFSAARTAPSPTVPSSGRPRRLEISATFSSPLERTRRQLLTSADPAYGFSNYFKPVILQTHPDGDSIWEILLCVALLLMLIVVLAASALYFMYKRGIVSAFCLMKKDHTMIRPSYQPIAAEDLPTEYVIRHKDSDFLFNAEFDALPRAKTQNSASDRAENQRKNRYNDIKACDETRVKLQPLNGQPGSDYVNGNFIKGYNNQKTFIATQGPLEHTVGDFWRMIYEHNCRIIVMVTNLRERGREQCVKYWPDRDEDNEPLAVGNMFEVHNVDTAYFADYTVREFVVRPFAASPPISHSKSPSRETQAASSPLLSPGGYSQSRASITFDCSLRAPSRANRSESMSSPSPRPESTEYANLAVNRTRPASSHSHRSHAHHGPEPLRVVQYHFTAWHDYKAPECTVSLLRLIARLRKLDEYNFYPVVVHCSAGVGRTGTLIAIDSMLDQCAQEGRVDIFGCVSGLRKQRNLMVQSLEQYVFIYKALAESHLFGHTDMTIEEFRQHYDRLKQPLRRERHLSLSAAVGSTSLSTNPQMYEHCNGNGTANGVLSKQLSDPIPTQANGGSTHTLGSAVGALFNQKLQKFRAISADNPRLTQLESEFQKLALSLEKPRPRSWAHKPENASRNRYDDAVPFDANRVILAPLLDYDNTYINASLVKGYLYPFILAQDPMGAETAFDFWRMIHDQRVSTMIMLSNEADFTRAEKYWPTETTVKEYLGQKQELVLQLIGEERHPDFTVRTLHYLFKSDETSRGRDVVQFAIQRLPNQTQPNPAVYLDLIGRVLERQCHIDDVGPILLHSRNGSTDTALFCCVSILLERLKTERMVDVFHTVKTLQTQRPLLINKLEQYAFCYDCVVEYLNMEGL